MNREDIERINKTRAASGMKPIRDIDRIDPFLAKLGEYWKLNPDLRFGQVVSMLESKCKIDFFYMEEGGLEGILDELIRGE